MHGVHTHISWDFCHVHGCSWNPWLTDTKFGAKWACYHHPTSADPLLTENFCLSIWKAWRWCYNREKLSRYVSQGTRTAAISWSPTNKAYKKAGVAKAKKVCFWQLVLTRRRLLLLCEQRSPGRPYMWPSRGFGYMCEGLSQYAWSL